MMVTSDLSINSTLDQDLDLLASWPELLLAHIKSIHWVNRNSGGFDYYVSIDVGFICFLSSWTNRGFAVLHHLRIQLQENVQLLIQQRHLIQINQVLCSLNSQKGQAQEPGTNSTTLEIRPSTWAKSCGPTRATTHDTAAQKSQCIFILFQGAPLI